MMPDRWKWLLLGHEPQFWLAMFFVSLARAGLTGESWKSAIVTVPSAVILSLTLTKGVIAYLGWPADPYGITIGTLIVLLCQPVMRMIVGLKGVQDLAEVIRAWRGK